MIELPIADLQDILVFPKLNILEPLFSERKEILPEQFRRRLVPILSGTYLLTTVKANKYVRSEIFHSSVTKTENYRSQRVK